MNMYGIEYSKPQVVLLQETGIGTAEVAARTCYDSFEASENPEIKFFNENLMDTWGTNVNKIEHSDLLDQLAWTHFHHSILEHTNLTYLIKGISRGVLQEHARHRIQAISVRSTRYTMSSVINAFVAERLNNTSEYPSKWFINTLLGLDLFVTADIEYNTIQAVEIFNRLNMQYRSLGKEEFINIAIAKSSLDFVRTFTLTQSVFECLQLGKKKRNVGDAFKHIVTDNWKVDMVVTFNLRSLKNYFQLRDSGAAYFQIQWLAEEMKKVTPKKYLDLIIKDK